MKKAFFLIVGIVCIGAAVLFAQHLGTDTAWPSGTVQIHCVAPVGCSSQGSVVTFGMTSGTTGLGVSSIVGVDNATASAITRTAQNIVASVPVTGEYRVAWYADQNAACTNATQGSVAITLGWTDATAARVSGSTTLTYTTSTSSNGAFASGTSNVWAKAGTAITDTETVTNCNTGTASFDFHAHAERIQ